MQYRNPTNKRRAVVYHVYGTKSTHGVQFFNYRQRLPFLDSTYTSKGDALAHLAALGYSIEGKACKP